MENLVLQSMEEIKMLLGFICVMLSILTLTAIAILNFTK